MFSPQRGRRVVVYYNKNEFEKAGFPDPTDNWTWSRMMADAAKLKVMKGSTQTQWGLCDAGLAGCVQPSHEGIRGHSLSETKADPASPGSSRRGRC